MVLSDIPAHRELAGYFPAANVTLMPSDAAPAAVAERSRARPRSAACPRPPVAAARVGRDG